MKKWFKLCLQTGIVLCIVALCWTGYVQWKIHSVQDHHSEQGYRDVAIILGAALWNDYPSPALRERLNHGMKLYEQKLVQQIIVSGGLGGRSSGLTEAEGMKRYLIQQGIPEEAIILENQAKDTYENLKFSFTKMEEHGWNSAYVVTHTYHGARAYEMALEVGYDQPALFLTDSQVMNMFYHHARETLAFTKWRWNKWFIR